MTREEFEARLEALIEEAEASGLLLEAGALLGVLGPFKAGAGAMRLYLQYTQPFLEQLHAAIRNEGARRN